MMCYTVGSGLSVSDVPNLFLPEVRGSHAVESAGKGISKTRIGKGAKGERETPRTRSRVYECMGPFLEHL